MYSNYCLFVEWWAYVFHPENRMSSIILFLLTSLNAAVYTSLNIRICAERKTMHIHFSPHSTFPRWAWTEGLSVQGQQEITVPLTWQVDDIRDQQITRLLKMIEDYISSQPKRITAGQTMHYGWTTLRFAPASHSENRALLQIEEIQHPFSHDTPQYVAGAVQAIHLQALQDAAMQRNRVTGVAITPHSSHLAIVCRSITPETIQTCRPLHIERNNAPEKRYSGWFIGCMGQEHNHDDPDELVMIHLQHLVEYCPALFPYLSSPVGTALMLEETQVIFFGPDQQEGHPDPVSPLVALPILDLPETS
jgi:hypothetical protein